MEKETWFYTRKYRENGKPYYLAVRHCEKCGAEFNSGNIAASKYCPECAEAVKKELTRERVRRYRERKKAAAADPADSTLL